MSEMIQSMSPDARVAMLGVLVFALMNPIKRLPQIPSEWVPLASMLLAFALSSLYYAISNLALGAAGWNFALEVVFTGSMPIAMHKCAKPLWVALLGEESAEKWLGQADGPTS